MRANGRRGEAENAQTLARGLAILEAVKAAPGTLTGAQLAALLALPRSVTYRLLRTLENLRFAKRLTDGTYELGTAVVALAHGPVADVRRVAQPELDALAAAFAATALLAVADGDDVVVAATGIPLDTDAYVGYRIGFRHAQSIGATGLALQAARPPRAGETAAVKRARARGYAVSVAQVKEGVAGIAAPIVTERGVHGSIGIVTFSPALDESAMAPRILEAAGRIADALRAS